MKSVIVLLGCVALITAGCVDHGVTVENQSTGSVPLVNGSSRKILKEVPPEYPAYLRAKKIAGAVVVRMWVRPDGTVARTEARYAAHPDLIPYATAAVAKWVFEPAPSGDNRVIVLEMPITFALQEKKTKEPNQSTEPTPSAVH